MGRRYLTSVLLTDGRRVGYSLFHRGRIWYVRFVNVEGRRVKVGLGVEKKTEAVKLAEGVVRAAHEVIEWD